MMIGPRELWQTVVRPRIHRPLATLMTLVILALGLGSVTTIATVVRAVFVESLPFPEPERLVFLRESTAQSPRRWVAWENFLDWRERQQVFETMAAHAHRRVTLSGGERPVSVLAVLASADLFPLLEARPVAGRLFSEEDDRGGAEPVVVLDHRFWQQHLGGRENAVGETLEIGGEAHRIVGVLEEDFLYPRDFRDNALYLPLTPSAESWGRRAETHPGLSVTARLAEGFGLGAARAEMQRITAALAEEFPETNRGHGIYLVSLRERVVGDLDQPLLALLTASFLVLLLAVVSIANLELAQVAERRPERLLRRTLGARPGALVGSQLAAGTTLGLLGGVLGLGVSGTLLALAPRLVDFEALGAFGNLVLGSESLVLTGLSALTAGVLFSIAPCFMVWREAVHGRGAGTGSRIASGLGRQRFRRGLVAIQLALALALSLAATLAVASYVSLLRSDPGFEARQVLSFAVSLPGDRYPDPEPRQIFWRRLVERLEGLPDIETASVAAPLLNGWSTAFEVEGRASEEGLVAEMLRVGPAYFDVLGIDLVRGRAFEASDGRAGEDDDSGVAIIGRRLAETLWPDEPAVGRRLRLATDPADAWREVVGVVEHVKNRGIQRESRIQLYLPQAEAPETWAWIALRTTGDPMAVAGRIDTLVAELETRVVVNDVRAMESVVASHREGPRLLAVCLGFFAVVTLAIAVLGVYGVVAASLVGRRRELGVRLALGARPPELGRRILGEGLLLAGLGIVGGLALGATASRWLAHQLYGVTVGELWVWLSLPLLLTGATLLASLPLARRAGQLDPSALLRDQEGSVRR